MSNNIIKLLTTYKYNNYPLAEAAIRLIELGNFHTTFTEIELPYEGITGEVHSDNIDLYICKNNNMWYRIDISDRLDSQKLL